MDTFKFKYKELGIRILDKLYYVQEMLDLSDEDFNELYCKYEETMSEPENYDL